MAERDKTMPIRDATRHRCHPCGRDPKPARVVDVAPEAKVDIIDVVSWLDQGFKGSGDLEICPSGELDMTSRAHDIIASDHDCFPGGTSGLFRAGEVGGAGLTAGEFAWLGQLRESAAFRTNIVLVNTGAESATAGTILVDAIGAVLASHQVEVGPGEWYQEDRPFQQAPGRICLDAASARAAVASGDPVVADATVFDDTTKDPTTIPIRWGC